MIVVLVVLAAVFAALTLLVRAGGAVVMLDGAVQAGLTAMRLRPIVVGFEWLTQAGTGGTGAIVSLVASALLWSSGRGRLVMPLWVAFLGAEATTWSMKFIAGRARPPFVEGLTAASPSFPSAHSTVTIAVYGFLAMVVAAGAPARFRNDIMAVTAVLVVLIGFSRLLLSLHYLSDVVAGAVVGAFWLVLAWRMVQAGG